MRSIEIIIDSEDKQDTDDIFSMFVTMISFMDGNNICWRETTENNKNRVS